MDGLKVILVQDGTSKGVTHLDIDALPKGIEVIGSLRIDRLGVSEGSKDGTLVASSKKGSHAGVSQGIAGEGQPGSGFGVSRVVFPQAEGEELEDRPVTLTRTEVEVLRLLAKGYENKEIAEEMFISINTVKSHVSSILRKLRVRNRAQAVRYVYKYGVSQ